MGQTIFVVGEPTVMIGGGVEDLVLGATVTVSYGPMMTMSLPPQTAALSGPDPITVRADTVM